MRVIGATREQLLRASRETGVLLKDLRITGPDGVTYSFSIRRLPDGDYPLRDVHTGRVMPGLVNWYGYRDFFRALFSLAPDAIIRTAWETYHGKDDFCRRYHETAFRILEKDGVMFTPLEVA